MTDIEKTYNRVIIVGNGFDLACGLKSSYQDFILDILKNGYLDAIKNGEIKTLFFELKYIETSEDYINKDIKFINNASRFNEIINYFKQRKTIEYKSLNLIFRNIIESNTKNWVDIESIYFKEIKKRWGEIKLKPENETEIIEEVENLNNNLTDISNALKDYLNLIKSNISISSREDKLENLRDLIYEKLRDEIIKNLPDKFKPVKDPEKVLILNFNYSDFAYQFLLRRNANYIALHGSLKDYTNNIVFGYGDDTNEIYKEMEASGHSEFLEKIKSFQYGRDNQYHKLLNFIEGENFEVFILGHSCGLSDKTLLKTIFEHQNCYAIKAFHYLGETEHFYKRMAIARHFDDKIAMRQKMLPYDEFYKIPQLIKHIR